MNKTGITRKIDGLGRIVLPKELRYSLNIEPGDDFEIFVDNETIVLRRYSKIINNEEYITKIINIFNSSLKFNVELIVNNVFLIKNENISKDLSNIIHERRIVYNINHFNKNNIVFPIVNNSDLIATLICVGNADTNEMERTCNIISKLIIDKIVE